MRETIRKLKMESVILLERLAYFKILAEINVPIIFSRNIQHSGNKYFCWGGLGVGKICVESGISISLLHAGGISWGSIESRENLA